MNAFGQKKKYFRIISPVLLLLLLPLFLWVVSTQRLELRKKATTGEKPVQNSIAWMTDSVSLAAQNFYIQIGRTFFTAVKNSYTIRSDSDGTTKKTFEVTWKEFNPEINDITEMKMILYFQTDGIYWWSNEIKTYNGKKNGEWIVYKPVSENKPFFKTLNGLTFTGSETLSSTPIGQGTIVLENMKLNPFFPSYCFQQDTPAKHNSQQLSQVYEIWKKAGSPQLPGCTPCVAVPDISNCSPEQECKKLLTSMLQSNTYYCPKPTPIPLETCVGKPNGNYCKTEYCPPCEPGMKCLTYCLQKEGICQNGHCIISNTTIIQDNFCIDKPDQTPCPGGHCLSMRCVKNTLPYQTDKPPEPTSRDCPLLMPPAPGSNCKIVQPPSCPRDTVCCPIIICPTITRPPVGTPVPTTSPSPTPESTFPQTLHITFQFAQVPDDRARNAKVKVGILTPTSELWTQPLGITYVGTGTTPGNYKVSFTLPKALDTTQLYRVVIKGEKHIASKICKQFGQTTVCGTTDWIRITTYNYGIDYTKRPLEPGDIPPQDNVTDINDFNRLKAILGKSSTQQSDADKYTGDLNYDGIVNTKDILLIRKSLETRNDET